MSANAADSIEMSTPPDSVDAKPAKKGLKFWMIMLAVGLAGLLTAMEATITSTVLPSIVASLGGQENYIWVSNGYFLAMTSLQPLVGQLANVFGRRWPLIISTAAFTLGSGIAGGANNIATLIGGRVVQGIGAAGINVLVELVVCDLTSLRDRGVYLAIIFGCISLGTALGPFFGGLIVTYSSWRWVFYMALPVGGAALIMLVLFLQVKYERSTKLATKLTKIDWLGTILFVASVSSVLIAIGWAGAVYPWSSFRVVVPIVLGFAGLVGFMIFQASPLAPNPTVPLKLFSNQTSLIAFFLTFLNAIATIWPLYFLPVYFQGVLAADPSRAGVMLLPSILALIPAAMVAGVILSKTGRFKLIQITGFLLMTVGLGLFALLDENSSTGFWVGFQLLSSAGSGLVIPTLLPAVMARLTDDDTALATGTWSFVRSFALTWGTAIPAAIFNNRAQQLASSGAITDATVAADFMAGNAYQQATASYLDTLSEETRKQVQVLLSDSLREIWYVAVAFGALGLILNVFIREVPLRRENTGSYGMAEEDKSEKPQEMT